ncbi:MAG: hypothetical protein ACOYOT_05145 [Bacteroidales bacterium]
MRQHAENSKYIFLIFLVWPFVALIQAIYHFKASWAKNVIWFFVVFYGYTMVVVGDSNDSTRERDALISLNHQVGSFDNTNLEFYSQEEGDLDIVNPIIIFVVSRFTDNYHFLFAAYAFVFGFFYSRNIWFFLNRSTNLASWFAVLVVFALAFVIGFWNINGFRFWTASHVFIYGVLLYLFERSFFGLIVVLSSFLVHFSFMLPISVFIGYLILGNRIPFYFGLYVLTFFVKELNIDSLGAVLKTYLPSIFHNRVEIYTNEENAEAKIVDIGEVAWHVTYSTFFLRWTIVAFVGLFYSKSKKLINGNFELTRLFSFTLLFASVANVAALVPSGGRYLFIANFLFLGFIFLFIQIVEIKSYWLLWRNISFVTFIFFDIVGFRYSTELMGIMGLFGNFIFASISQIDLTVIDFIKSIF